MLYLYYEDMKADLSTAVHTVAQFLASPMSREEVEALVGRFTIETMKKERATFEPVSVQWKEGFQFVRNGQVGDSRDAFSPAAAALFDEAVRTAWPSGVPGWAQPLVLE